ncbi:MAG TPA: sigma-70 family RNA polymerase sigma factor [Solirubrobacterales bacterium]|jgi:RNA polymerase sigma factor (sigma-70 family)|nr:sigma-70 family RNA polymerase sigma factor [Solirubrobacterales bacterium]
MAKQQDFVRAYEEHVWRVYGYLAYRLRSRSDTEDLTQLTFERALRSWSSFDPERSPLGAWLLVIARNVYIDHRRREGTASRKIASGRPIDGALAGAVPGPEREFGLDPALAAALRRLSRREREVVALRFGGDLRLREIAEAMGLTVANAQQVLSRALRRLRSLLEPPDYEANGPVPATPRAATASRDTPQAR